MTRYIPETNHEYDSKDILFFLRFFSTCCLQHTLRNSLYYVPAYTGYTMSFYLFPKALTKYSLHVAYTIWSAFGILMTTLYTVVSNSQLPSLEQVLGMMFVVIGIWLTCP